jgi:hypothetical protein
MGSHLLNFAFQFGNASENLQKVVNEKFREVALSDIQRWVNDVRPRERQFVKVNAQVLYVKRNIKEAEITTYHEFSHRNDSKIFKSDGDSRVVLFR